MSGTSILDTCMLRWSKNGSMQKMAKRDCLRRFAILTSNLGITPML